MKKGLIIALTLLLALAFSLTACSAPAADSNAPQSETPTLDAIRASGQLVLGTEAGYAPFEFSVMENGVQKIVGFDISIAQVIADRLGVELIIKDQAFDGLVTALQNGEFDIVMACMNPNPERAEQVDFSDLYYLSTHSFIVRKGDEGLYGDLASFAGLMIGVQMGTTQEGIVTEQMTDSTPLALAKIPTLIQELKSGNIAAVLAETPVADNYVAANADTLAVAPFTVPDESGGIAVAVQKDQQDLLDFINDILAELEQNGQIDQFYSDAFELAQQQAAE